MDKQRKAVLEKLDRIILYLTELRMDSTGQDWFDYYAATWAVRNARRELIAHVPTETIAV